MIISREELCSFLNAKNACPHDRLGMHQVVENKKIVGVGEIGLDYHYGKA